MSPYYVSALTSLIGEELYVCTAIAYVPLGYLDLPAELWHGI
jgi:hypothetical protein